MIEMADNGRYSLVSRRMWNDAEFRSLSAPPPNAQTLWIRLLTGPELTNIPGLFTAWEAGLAQALGWSLEDFQRCWEEISSKLLVKSSKTAGLIWVPNSIKHNPPANHNVITSWSKTWAELPECELKFEAHEGLRLAIRSLGNDWEKAFLRACPLKGYQGTLPLTLCHTVTGNPSLKGSSKGQANGMAKQDQEQEQDQEQIQEVEEFEKDQPPATNLELVDIKRVFEFWKKVMKHPQSKLDAKRKKRICARLREGFTPENLRDALLGALKDDFLMGKDKYAKRKFDGIETLLRDAAQVERLIELNSAKRDLTGKMVAVNEEEAKKKAAEHESAVARAAERARQKVQAHLSQVKNNDNVTESLSEILKKANI